MLIRSFSLLMALIVLAACQAEEIEIDLDVSDIERAFSNEDVFVDFEAVVGEKFTTVDDEKRQTLDRIIGVLKTSFPNSDIELDISNDGYEIEIEGSVSVNLNEPIEGAPYYIAVSPGPLADSILVQLKPSGAYSRFARDLKDIEFMLKPDEFQNAEFKLTGNGEKVLAFGANVNGSPQTLKLEVLGSDKTRIDMSDGIWKNTPVGFLLLQ